MGAGFRGFQIHCYERVRVRHCCLGNYFIRNSFPHVTELVVDLKTGSPRRTDFRKAYALGRRRGLRRPAATSLPACLRQVATPLLVEGSPDEFVKFGNIVESRRSRALRMSLNSEGFNEFDGFKNLLKCSDSLNSLNSLSLSNSAELRDFC